MQYNRYIIQNLTKEYFESSVSVYNTNANGKRRC